MTGERPSEPLTYTVTEVESYLPTGWTLVPEGDAGALDGDAWRLCARDGADVEWAIEVEAEAARERGRLEALAAAVRATEARGLGRKSLLG